MNQANRSPTPIYLASIKIAISSINSLKLSRDSLVDLRISNFTILLLIILLLNKEVYARLS